MERTQMKKKKEKKNPYVKDGKNSNEKKKSTITIS